MRDMAARKTSLAHVPRSQQGCFCSSSERRGVDEGEKKQLALVGRFLLERPRSNLLCAVARRQ